jgi:hypothetical protein
LEVVAGAVALQLLEVAVALVAVLAEYLLED